MLTEYRLKKLNERASKDSEKILSNIQINKGAIIADIGAGGGYYAFKFSQLTGDCGKVYAVEGDKKRIKYIKKTASIENIRNIQTCGIDENSLPIIDEKLDFVFMRNIFHHIQHPEKYFSNLRGMLKDNGKVVIIDYLPNMPGILISRTRHSTPKNKIINIMKKNGYSEQKDINSIYGFSFTIWETNDKSLV